MQCFYYKMDNIAKIKEDKAYNKCKLIVKKWEKDFKSKYSRTPSKFDIKEAPADIKYAYKKYFQLKCKALENTLSVCDIDEQSIGSPDDFQPPEPIESDSLSIQTELSIPTLPSGQELEKLLSDTHAGIRNDFEQESPIIEILSKKIFQNKKFCLRNPRKLTKTQTLVMTNNAVMTNHVDKENDKELHNTDPVKENVDVHNVDKFINHDNNKTLIKPKMFENATYSINNTTVRQINDKWLQRNTGLNIQNDENVKPIENFESFGLRNIAVTNKLDKNCDFIENSESEEDITLDKLKPALKKRKIDIFNTVEMIQNQHLKEDDLNTKVLRTSKTRKKTHLNSDRSSKVKENQDVKADDSFRKLPLDVTDYAPFGLDESVVPRHLTVTNVLKTVESTTNDHTNKIDSNKGIDNLQKKIECGTLNDNFVKINIEKKVFVRGKKNINYSKYKKQLWKSKKSQLYMETSPSPNKLSCFKCGKTDHMARYCTSHKGESLLPIEDYDENDLPTLEEMKNIVSKETNVSIPQQLSLCIQENNQIPNSFMKLLLESQDSSSSVQPIYTKQEECMEAIHKVLPLFGHNSLRPGQKETMERILCGKSTLLVLSTGGGKSLCYQLPAYIYSQHYKCITLVISPLVSLMEDQVLGMPEFLKAGCLHTNQPPTLRRKIIQYLKDGELNILLISPEALVSGDTSKEFAGLFKALPQIAFACIDEAHCVSQWSHNFRPSYLTLCRVLREKLNVKCILGLTATASQTTIKSIIEHINVPDGLAGVVTNPTLPDNLYLSVSSEKDKDRALLLFLNSEKIISFNSIIVYCIRRDECERIATMLRSCLQEPGKINLENHNRKRKRMMSYIAEAYHAGMSAAHRKRIQKMFMNGTLRIIVATIAFGMGINKSDVRCIIHYNTPSSFESYVQEVGRAGRDGQPAYCHVFMDKNNNDKNEILRHIHANAVDRSTIRKLLQKVFIPCECIKLPDDLSVSKRCKGHEVGIPIDDTVEELDLPSENIATLLCYMELHAKRYVKVLNKAYVMCKISSYNGPQKILEAAKNCPPLAMAYLLASKKNRNILKESVLEFHVIEVAAAIGWESGMTKYYLKNLEWTKEENSYKRSQLKVEFNTLGFRIKAPGDLTSTELDCMLDYLHETVLSQEKNMLYQLEECNKSFKKLAKYSLDSSISFDFILENSEELKCIIRSYFERENVTPNITLEERPLDIERVASDVRALIFSYKDCNFSGRSVARIFQGISSPNYPALIWGKCKFWRSHLHEDFYGLIKVATQQIIHLKTSTS